MKAAIAFILLSAITASVAVQGQEEAVKDVNGNPIRDSKSYYMKPVIESNFEIGNPEGVWLSFFRPTPSDPCPQLAVVSGITYASPREPVLIYVVGQKGGLGIVYESTKVFLKFQRMEDFCPNQDGFWRNSNDEYPSFISGTNPPSTGFASFKIKKSNLGYKLYYEGYVIRVHKRAFRTEGILYLDIDNRDSSNPLEINFVPVAVRDEIQSVNQS